MIRDQIIKSLQKATGVEEIELDIPENENFGDYSTNVALKLKSQNSKGKSTSQKSKSPRDLAQTIIEKLKKDENLQKIVEKIEVAGPGFINFWLSKDILVDNLLQIDKLGEKYGHSQNLKGQRIMFEFGQPNTHKLPHIGHLFSYIYGEATIRILLANGATIFRANYQGDVGLHVAKCLWAFMKENPKEPKELENKVKLLQKMYQKGSFSYEESEEAKKEIQDLNKKVYEKDEGIRDLWEKTREWSIEYYKHFEKRLGVTYDRYYYESQVYDEGVKIVKKNLNKVFKRSEGAIIFEGSRYGLHDRVFVTQYDTPTYEAKDLYLEQLKFKEWPFDLLIITTANEQTEYFKVVYKAIEKVEPKLEGKLAHIGFGMVNLKTGKMSSRTGNIISAVELVDIVVDKVKQLSSDKKVAESVGLAAVKYSFLKNNPLQNTAFSVEESIAKEGNSGPYLQYTHARTHSVLAKAKTQKPKLKTDVNKIIEEEFKIIRLLSQYPEVIMNAAKTYSPNVLCNYLYNLAQKYNAFYNSNRILGSDREKIRVVLTSAVGQVLKNGLKLLGIEAPEKM